MSSGGIYKGPGGEELHGDGRPVERPISDEKPTTKPDKIDSDDIETIRKLTEQRDRLMAVVKGIADFPTYLRNCVAIALGFIKTCRAAIRDMNNQ